MSDTARFNVPVPLTTHDLKVLAWFAEWTPEHHRAAWGVRRRWEPGFRFMTDCSTGDPRPIEKAKAEMSYPPAIGTKEATSSLVHRLIAYELLEGVDHGACRLTARGRAALKSKGIPCPDGFVSHAPDVFDDHTLLPVMGHNTRIDFMDTAMSRVGPEYRVAHGEPLPDNETTWNLMLAEYEDDRYRGRGTLTAATAGLRVASCAPDRFLNGSLRGHPTYIGLIVQDQRHNRVLEAALSLEGLADLLVSNHDVPITLDYYIGRDGMPRSNPAPPPVSVTRRMMERVSRSTQDVKVKLSEIIELLSKTSMPKGAQKAAIDALNVVIGNMDANAAFAAEQAVEEVSAAAEALMTISAERMRALPPGVLALDGSSPTLLLTAEEEEV